LSRLATKYDVEKLAHPLTEQLKHDFIVQVSLASPGLEDYQALMQDYLTNPDLQQRYGLKKSPMIP
jgi:hypothetical protein